MFSKLTLINWLARKSLANGSQPKIIIAWSIASFYAIQYFCALSCFYAVASVSNDKLIEQQYLVSF